MTMVMERLNGNLNYSMLLCVYRVLLSDDPDEFVSQLMESDKLPRIMEAIEDNHKVVIRIIQ